MESKLCTCGHYHWTDAKGRLFHCPMRCGCTGYVKAKEETLENNQDEYVKIKKSDLKKAVDKKLINKKLAETLSPETFEEPIVIHVGQVYIIFSSPDPCDTLGSAVIIIYSIASAGWKAYMLDNNKSSIKNGELVFDYHVDTFKDNILNGNLKLVANSPEEYFRNKFKKKHKKS